MVLSWDLGSPRTFLPLPGHPEVCQGPPGSSLPCRSSRFSAWQPSSWSHVMRNPGSAAVPYCLSNAVGGEPGELLAERSIGATWKRPGAGPVLQLCLG